MSKKKKSVESAKKKKSARAGAKATPASRQSGKNTAKVVASVTKVELSPELRELMNKHLGTAGEAVDLTGKPMPMEVVLEIISKITKQSGFGCAVMLFHHGEGSTDLFYHGCAVNELSLLATVATRKVNKILDKIDEEHERSHATGECIHKEGATH